MMVEILTKFSKWKEDYIINADTNSSLRKFEDWSIDLTITSPAYYLGKDYEWDHTFEQYLEYHKECIKLLYKKTKDCWAVYRNVAQTPIDWEIFPLWAIFYNYFKEVWFHLKNRIIWHFEWWINTKNRLSWRYENILWFVKDKNNYKFNLDDIRVPSKWQSDKRCNPKWKNPTDVWEFYLKDLNDDEKKFFFDELIHDKTREHADLSDNFWFFDRVVNVSKEKTEHPCQFPEKMIDRLIKSSSDEWDLVFDPFFGSWTVGKKAVELWRHFIGIDRSTKYCEIAKNRIESFTK